MKKHKTLAKHVGVLIVFMIWFVLGVALNHDKINFEEYSGE